MSDRYTDWFRSTGDPVGNGRLIEFGKKLLGSIANLQRLGAPPNLIRRARYTDGSEITAQILHGQPVVRVKGPSAPQPEATCELYVESGLLDLGTNTASDATARFGRGRPTFADGAATLHFGTGIDCSSYGGLNGKVQVGIFGQTIGLRSACLSSGGSSADSIVTDGGKKQCQAVMPASLWSGHMARYVAAIYGSKAVRYRLGSANAIELYDKAGATTLTLTPWASSSWGLVQIGAGLLFVEILSDGTVNFRRPHFGSCGQYVYQFWQQMGQGGSDAKKSARAKVLTVALSDCEPTLAVHATVSLGISGSAIGSYGWAFDTDLPRVATVLLDGGNTKRYEITFASDGHGSYTATPVLIESAAVIPKEWAIEVISPDESSMSPNAASLYDSGTDRVTAGDTYDFPVTCWYEAGARRVIRYAMDSSSLFDYDTFNTCADYNLPGPVYFPHLAGDGGSAYDCTTQEQPKRATVVCGLYCKSDATTVWSKVTSRTAPQYELSGTWYVGREQDSRLHVTKQVGSKVDITLSFNLATKPGGVLGYPAGAVDPNCADIGTSDCPVSQRDETTPSADTGQVGSGGADLCSGGDAIVGFDYTDLDGTVTYGAYGMEAAAFSSPIDDPTDPWRAIAHYAPDIAAVLPFGTREAGIAMDYGLQGGSGTYYNLVLDLSAYSGEFVADTQFSFTESYSYNFLNGNMDCHPPVGIDYSVPFSSYGPVTNVTSRSQHCMLGTFDMFLSVVTVSGVTTYTYADNSPNHIVPPVDGSRQVRASETFESTVDVGGNTDYSQTNQVVLAFDAHAFTPGDFSAAQCADDYEYVFRTSYSDAHADVATSGGTKALAQRFVEKDSYMSDDFQYRALRSRLNAKLTPQVNLTFGASVGTDRETLTGGYSSITSPSFVGWA